MRARPVVDVAVGWLYARAPFLHSKLFPNYFQYRNPPTNSYFENFFENFFEKSFAYNLHNTRPKPFPKLFAKSLLRPDLAAHSD